MKLLDLIKHLKQPKAPKFIDKKGYWIGIPIEFEKQHLEYFRKIKLIEADYIRKTIVFQTNLENEYNNNKKNNIEFSKL